MTVLRTLLVLVTSLSLVGVAEAQKGGGKPGGGGGVAKVQNYFDEKFTSDTLNTFRLIDDELGFVIENGFIKRNANDGIFSEDRRFIRTAANDYNSRDFRYRVFLSQPEQVSPDLIYVGMGSGQPDLSHYDEPFYSLMLRIHRGYVGGRVDVAAGTEGFQNYTYFYTLGSIPELYNGDLEVAVEKIDRRVAFTVSWQCEEPVPCSLSDSVDIDSQATFLNTRDSFLFFGNASGSYVYDQAVITKIR